MKSSSLVAKQRTLTENETETTFNTWQQSMMFHIVVDSKFSRYTDTTDLGTWKPTSVANRGFVNDVTTGENAVPQDIRMTAIQKAAILKVLLGSISTFAPVISNKYITEQATSLDDVFDRLRSHFGFRITGGRMLELAQFGLLPNESNETLWERMSAFIEDNLLKKAGGIKHLGAKVEDDELPTPTLWNVVVVLWLKAISPELPTVVKQRFSTQLRTNTIYSLRDDISDAIPSLLADVQDREYNVSFTKGYHQKKNVRKFHTKSASKFPAQKQKKCCLCESAGRPGFNTHFLSECSFLPSDDRKYMSNISKIRDIVADTESDDDSQDGSSSSVKSSGSVKSVPVTSRVKVVPSPIMGVYVNDNSADITLDSGSEIDLMTETEANRLRLPWIPSRQGASQADGDSPLQVVGEVEFKCVRGHHSFKFHGLVVKKLNCPILAGMPFLYMNDVFTRPSKGTIYLGDCCVIKTKSADVTGASRTCKATILKAPQKVCLLPGDELTVPVPDEFKEKSLAIEPRSLTFSDESSSKWLDCQTTSSNIDGEIILKNLSSDPVLLRKDEQFAQIRHIDVKDTSQQQNVLPVPPVPPVPPIKSDRPYSASIDVDPSNILTKSQREKFRKIHLEHDEVFSPQLGCYNGASGPFKHVITMGESLPPQRRGRNPMYNRSNLELLQAKCDELVQQGVLARPEDVNVSVEYVSPSFLIKKSSGGHRLVTAFNELAEHTRHQPTAMPNVDDVLRSIGQWKYVVKSDLRQAYYQILLDIASRKYVGIVTPFRGTLVYLRAVMGLPGSEASLECLLSRILGDLMMDGSVVKLADDLYTGGDSVEEVTHAWSKVLSLLEKNGLKLSPAKTVCCPTSTIVLGWLWEQGTLRASPHRINALLQCDPPKNVNRMRSFVGSYKSLSKVLRHHADYLDPFEKLCATNRPATEKVNWTDELHTDFIKAKKHLESAKMITLPRRGDALQIITDASAVGLASAMYSIRNGKPVLSGLFNAKRRPHQVGWLPCELEALAITASVKHFSPYIVQSTQRTKILTDSLPCVNAFKKLARGEFSSSPRVTTFLSTLSHYQVDLQHIPGKSNTFSDFASRNPVSCDGSCQICSFIEEVEDSVVNSVSVTDILSGGSSVPYASRGAWFTLQQDCESLRKVAKHLRHGTVPHRKAVGVGDIKRYLKHVKLSSSPADSLIVVDDDRPLQPTKQRIVVPRGIVDGLLTALHLKLSHPSKDQLKIVFNRAFYALDLEKSAATITDGCHMCASLKKIPSYFSTQSTAPPPAAIGVKYSADVIKKERQKILLVREYVSSFSDAVFVQKEDSGDLKEGLIRVLSRLRPSAGLPVTVKVDPATGFQALQKDQFMSSLGITLELGDAKNVEKNPVSERAISEFHEEVAKLQPGGGPITETILSLAVSRLNSKVRGSGFSSIEMWTKRGMDSGASVDVKDEDLIMQKQEERIKNHLSSAKYKSRGKTSANTPAVQCGDVVYLYQDREKGRCRDSYLVADIQDSNAFVQKFVGNQLRVKRYRVKLSDLIVVKQPAIQKDTAVLPETSESDSEPDTITITLRKTEEPALNEYHSDETSNQDTETDETAAEDDVEDVEEDPHVPELLKYPCSVCKQDVTDDDKGLLCDQCSQWCHIECGRVTERNYTKLKNSDEFVWSCPIHAEAGLRRSERIKEKIGRPPGYILMQSP